MPIYNLNWVLTKCLFQVKWIVFDKTLEAEVYLDKCGCYICSFLWELNVEARDKRKWTMTCHRPMRFKANINHGIKTCCHCLTVTNLNLLIFAANMWTRRRAVIKCRSFDLATWQYSGIQNLQLVVFCIARNCQCLGFCETFHESL